MSEMRLSLILWGAVLAIPLACTRQPPPGIENGPRITDPADSVLALEIERFTRMRIAADSFSGVVVLERRGTPLYRVATGLADRSSGAPNSFDTKFNLASVDKYFTRIAIRQLQQAGKLALTDSVGKHLPDYPNDRVRREVRLNHLMGMTSGMGDFGSDAEFSARRLSLKTLDDYVQLFARDTLLFAPGTKQSYSNAGYIVLGKIVERLSGQSYYEYVQRNIFDPAGMRNTGYFTLDDDTRGRAIGYTADPTAAIAPAAHPRVPHTSFLPFRGSSAGGGYSTAEDLLALSRALLSYKLLDRKHTDLMLDFGTPKPGEFGWSGWTGGAEGANTVFYMHTTGHTLVVLSNYDPPTATVYRRKLWSEWLPAWLAHRATPP